MAQGEVAVAVVEAGVPTAGRGIARRTLLHALDDVLAAGTGLVVGPRGAGKTNLLAQWAATCPLPVVWGRCTRGGVVLRSGSQAVTLTPAELSRAVHARRTPSLLVLDDVHELLGAGVGEELEHLLLTAAPDVHVLMGSRREPTFTLARAELAPPVVLTGTDLRMRTWEVDLLFRDVYGHPLVPEDVETLTHETEGWPAAVHLFHRATDALLPADRRRAVRALPTDTGYARDYLVGVVLAELDRPLVELLHRGAVFDELTATRCDAMGEPSTGPDPAPPAAPQLRELVRTWSLATTQDGVHYRLPRVLRGHLRAARDEQLGAAARAWHDRAQAVMAAEDPTARTTPATTAAAVGWAPFTEGAGGGSADDAWIGLVRAATRRDPAAQAGAARRLGGTAGALAEGLGLLLAGRLRDAGPPLRRAAEDPDGPLPLVLGAALAEAAFSGRPTEIVLGTLDRVHAEADRQGLVWLARLAHGMVVGFDGTVAARRRANEYAADRRGDRDPWGAALVRTWSALAGLCTGACEHDVWDEIVQQWQALDAAVPAAWARACGALAAAAHQLPEARDEAQVAEAVARAAGVPGALAYAYRALAATQADGAAELVALASTTARDTGVDTRPFRALGLGERPTDRRGPALVPASVRPADPPAVQVRCLGEFRMLVDGAPVDLTRVRPRARSALRVLALHAGRPVHRERLAEVLWGELDPRAALHNLHVSISAVRRALEPHVPTRASRLLVRDGEAYTLVLGPASTCDVAELERAVRAADRSRAAGDRAGATAALRRALDLYRGELLPEDGVAEWVVGPRDRVRLLAADAATDLAELELTQGRPERAVAAATRAIELDECRDHAWRLLVAAFTDAGDAAAAHRATHGYRAMLQTLGVTPIRAATVTSGPGTPPPRSPRASAGRPGTWS